MPYVKAATINANGTYAVKYKDRGMLKSRTEKCIVVEEKTERVIFKKTPKVRNACLWAIKDAVIKLYRFGKYPL